jgi:hypothetical protein
MPTSPPILLALTLLFIGLIAPSPSEGFAGYLSPPRLELSAKPGDVLREVVTIGNEDVVPAAFDVQSADWSLDALGTPHFEIATLAPGSCREWVRLERRRLDVGARSERRFRFEVHIPAEAKAQLCRFAILVSSGTQSGAVELSSIRLPVQGRIALIVYVALGDLKPALAPIRYGHESFQGRATPVVVIKNSGTAQGRLEGSLDGVDAAGKRLEFVVSNSVILPGETRTLPIWASEVDGKPPVYQRPLKLTGTLEWSGGKVPVNTTIE